MAGRLKYFLPVWEKITQDSWILEVVELRSGVINHSNESSLPLLSVTNRAKCHSRLGDLLQKQVVHLVPSTRLTQSFVSNLFLVPKKGRRTVL